MTAHPDTTLQIRAWAASSTSLAAVEAEFLAVVQYDVLQPDDLLAVGKLIPDASDHVAGLHRRFGPPVGLHPVEGGATHLPFLRPAVTGLHLKSHHRVRIGPHELDHLALHCH